MKTKIIYPTLMVFLTVFIYGTSAAQTPEQQFQKGIMKEEGEGSLKEAIELYKAVADNTKADKVLRAKALYQMGNCYEKLGQQEARNVYEKLVANYTDPQELVANAKRKLNNLNGSTATSDNSGIIVRQVWSPVKDVCDQFSVSPDGRYVLFHNYKSVQVGIRDLKTQKEWEVTTNGTWEEPVIQYPGDGGSIWSPDSKQIAYPWVVNPNKKNQYAELHIVNFDGSNDRLLIKEDGFDGPYPMVWSSDGKTIIGLNYSRTDKNNPNAFFDQIVIISVSDGSQKIITELENRKVRNITFSPDGNQIIFSAQQESGSENYDIYSVSKEGGPLVPLVTNKEEDINPIHLSGTNQVLFFSKHSGTFDLWAMNIDGGKPAGEPSIIKSALEETSVPGSVTAKGTLYYTSTRLSTDRYRAKLDFKSGEVVPEIVKITHKYPNQILHTIWSPNFMYAAYFIGAPYTVKGAPVKFLLKNMASGEEKEFSPDLLSVWFLPYVSPQWTLDEKGIIVKAWTKEGENGLFQIDIETGKYTKLKTLNLPYQKKWQSLWVWKEPQFSPDRETIYYTTAVDSTSGGEPLNLIAYSVNSGTEQILHRFEKEIRQRTISPDGKMIAFSHTFSDQNSLYVISVEGDWKIKKIAGFEEDVEVYPIGWTQDSQKALLAKQNTDGEIEIWSASLENSKPTRLFSADKLKAFKGATGLKIQYVGQDAYLTMKEASRITELWAMDNIALK